MDIKLEIQKDGQGIGISKVVLQPPMISPIWKNPFDLVSKKGEQQVLNIKILKSVFILS